MSELNSLSQIPKTITHLDLSFNSQLRNEAFSGVHDTLQYLNLSFCKSLTDQCLTTFSNFKLKVLLLEGCSGITGETGFLTLPKTLNKLVISGCPKVTDKGILALPRETITTLEMR